ncbi:MAG: LysR substrate-binding domain-containing protein [Candidatus Korobacteraceae bacterium]|jgi:DNA-binding transcriptional LysR family regulator
MEPRQLRYFLAAAQELHFTRAAQQLHVAQPALSQQIRLLEEEVGTKLFERSNRRVFLTPAGEAFRIRATLSVEQATRAASDALSVGRGESGSVSIGFVSSTVYSALPSLVRWFRANVPKANIELKELEPWEQWEPIEHGTLDIGMMHASLDNPSLEAVVISREKLVIALPEHHSVAMKQRVHLKLLEGETFIVPPRHRLSGYNDAVVAACRRNGFAPAKILTTRFLQTSLGLVAGGLGVSLVPASFRENLRVRGVVYRCIMPPVPEIELIAVWRKGETSPLLQRVQATLRNFEALLREEKCHRRWCEPALARGT